MSEESLNHFTSYIDQFESQIIDWVEKTSNQESVEPKIAEDKIKEMYYIAYRLYHDQNYKQAIHFFRVLTNLNPWESKYWKGLGASLQMQKDYDQALRSYVCSQILNKDQPDPYLYVHAADCFFALGQIEQGLKALEGAYLSGQEQNDEKVINHVALMRQVWSNKNN